MWRRHAKIKEHRIYRFGKHEMLTDDTGGIKLYHIKADEGFESFVIKISSIIVKEGKMAFYVFDCLTGIRI